MLAALTAGAASAQDDVRAALVDLLLTESTVGVTPEQLGALTELARRVPAADPVGPDVLYWLAHANAELGNLDAARTTLLEGIRTGQCPRCRELFQALEIERLAASRGTTWTFDDPHHGVFHPSEVQGYGSIRLGTGDGRGVLEWVTVERPDAVDRLVMGLAEGAEAVVLEVRSVGHPAALHVFVEDLAGRRWVTPSPLAVPADTWSTLTVTLQDLSPVDGAWPITEASARRLELVDWSGSPAGRAGAASTFWFDALTVR